MDGARRETQAQTPEEGRARDVVRLTSTKNFAEVGWSPATSTAGDAIAYVPANTAQRRAHRGQQAHTFERGKGHAPGEILPCSELTGSNTNCDGTPLKPVLDCAAAALLAIAPRLRAG